MYSAPLIDPFHSTGIPGPEIYAGPIRAYYNIGKIAASLSKPIKNPFRNCLIETTVSLFGIQTSFPFLCSEQLRLRGSSASAAGRRKAFSCIIRKLR